MKWIRKVARILIIIAAGLIIFVVLLIGPIDRTPLAETSGYQTTLAALDTLKPEFLASKNTVEAAWGKVNITPAYPMPLAGYRMRENFTSVHDSLFCRVVALRSGDKTAYIISADLLLFPPSLRQAIEHAFPSDSKTFLFFSATHTHNGVGGWDDSMVGNFVLGRFREEWVKDVSKSLLQLINNLSFQKVQLAYVEANADEYAINRVDPASPADTKLRGIQLLRADGSKSLLITYSAHATSISKKSLALSGDYPSALVNELEQHGFTQAMFLSGMVGSHRLNGIAEQEFDMVAAAGRALSEKLMQANMTVLPDSIMLAGSNFPIDFNPSQLRLSRDWRIRDWVFRLAFHPLQGGLTTLEIGNIILIGTPCDFSGEIAVEHQLDSLAKAHGKHLIITSFNGNYDGYITADHHYDTSDKEEQLALNWVGPYHGNYFADMIKKIISR